MKGRGKVTSLVRSVISAAALHFLLGCGAGDGPVDGGPLIRDWACGTEVPDPTEMVVGCLMDESDMPAAGIVVRATRKHFPSGSDTGADSVGNHSDTTDSQGRFSFASLGNEAYLITANDDTLRSMIPRHVIPVPGDLIWLKRNVLFRNGTVAGRIVDSQSLGPLSSVVCEVSGMPFSAQSDHNGQFSLTLPSGGYDLDCADNHNALVPTRARIEVIGGKTIPITLSVLNKAAVEARPQAPESATASYDPVTGIVHLSWPPVAPTQSGILYFVRRIDTAYGRSEDRTYFTPDTFYSDVISWPRDVNGGIAAKSKTVFYNVGATFSKSYSLSEERVNLNVIVEPPRFLGPEAAVKAEGERTGFQVGDTARVIGTWRNLFRAGHRLAWTLDATGAELKPSRNLADSAGADTLLYPCDSVGTHAIRFKVTDLSGAAASALQVIEVKPAP